MDRSRAMQVPAMAAWSHLQRAIPHYRIWMPGGTPKLTCSPGALMRMGQELGIPTPYNEYTYHMIKALEEKNDGLFDYAAKASDLTCAK